MCAVAFVVSSVTHVKICSQWAHNLSLNRIPFQMLHLHSTIMQQDPCSYARVLLLSWHFYFVLAWRMTQGVA